MSKFKCETGKDIIEPARQAAQRHGLDNTSEYIRIALEYLVEHGLPREFEGRRSRLKVGRPAREAVMRR